MGEGMLASLNLVFIIGLIFTIYASIRATISENSATNKDKVRQDKLGQLSYYDYKSKCYRFVETGEACHVYFGHDEDGKPYTYCISMGKKPKFLGAKYDIFDDIPIKYTKRETDYLFNNHYIKTTKDLYDRWEDKRPWEMPEGSYDLVH